MQKSQTRPRLYAPRRMTPSRENPAFSNTRRPPAATLSE